MGSLKNVLAVLVGLVALGFGIYHIYVFNTGGDAAGSHHLWWSIGGFVVAFICGLVYFLGRVAKEEEIHITQ